MPQSRLEATCPTGQRMDIVNHKTLSDFGSLLEKLALEAGLSSTSVEYLLRQDATALACVRHLFQCYAEARTKQTVYVTAQDPINEVLGRGRIRVESAVRAEIAGYRCADRLLNYAVYEIAADTHGEHLHMRRMLAHFTSDVEALSIDVLAFLTYASNHPEFGSEIPAVFLGQLKRNDVESYTFMITMGSDGFRKLVELTTEEAHMDANTIMPQWIPRQIPSPCEVFAVII